VTSNQNSRNIGKKIPKINNGKKIPEIRNIGKKIPKINNGKKIPEIRNIGKKIPKNSDIGKKIPKIMIFITSITSVRKYR
jgi:hypothetical protein